MRIDSTQFAEFAEELQVTTRPVRSEGYVATNVILLIVVSIAALPMSYAAISRAHGFTPTLIAGVWSAAAFAFVVALTSELLWSFLGIERWTFRSHEVLFERRFSGIAGWSRRFAFSDIRGVGVVTSEYTRRGSSIVIRRLCLKSSTGNAMGWGRFSEEDATEANRRLLKALERISHSELLDLSPR